MLRGRVRALLIFIAIFAVAPHLLSCDCEKKEESQTQPKTPRIFLVLDRTELSIGEILGVSVKVENVEDVFGVAFDLMFSHDAFELAGSRAGEFLNRGQHKFLSEFQNDDPDRLVVGISEVGSASGVSGDGVVASFELKAKRAGGYSIALDRAAIKNPELNSIDMKVGKPQDVQVK